MSTFKKSRRYSVQPVDAGISYPTQCRQCRVVIEKQVDALELTIISKGRDAYTRAPITRHTLLPFCSTACANLYQKSADE